MNSSLCLELLFHHVGNKWFELQSSDVLFYTGCTVYRVVQIWINLVYLAYLLVNGSVACLFIVTLISASHVNCKLAIGIFAT